MIQFLEDRSLSRLHHSPLPESFERLQFLELDRGEGALELSRN